MTRAGEFAAPAWVVTAVALAVLIVAVLWTEGRWSRPRLERAPGRDLGPADRPVVRAGTAIGGALGAVATVTVAVIALAGPPQQPANAATPLVHVVLWGAGPVLALLVGDWWRVVGPGPALARLGGGVAAPHGRVDTHPAAALLAGFGWLVTVHPAGDDPRVIGQAVVVYAAVLGVGAAWAGRGWVASADPFSALFTAIGGLGPLRRRDGRIELRAPLTAPSDVPTRPATAVVLLVALGVLAFTALSRTAPWGTLRGLAGTAIGPVGADTVGLVACIAGAGALYRWAWRDAAASTGAVPAELAGWFAPTLVPIVVAFSVSLTAGPLVAETARLPRLLADPLGGGTVGIVATPPVRVVLAVQAAALIGGHVAAVLVLRDRAASHRADVGRTITGPVAVIAAFLAVGTLTMFGG